MTWTRSSSTGAVLRRHEPLSGWAGEVLVCTTGNLVDLLSTQRRVSGTTTADSMFDRLAWTCPRTRIGLVRRVVRRATGIGLRGARGHA